MKFVNFLIPRSGSDYFLKHLEDHISGKKVFFAHFFTNIFTLLTRYSNLKNVEYPMTLSFNIFVVINAGEVIDFFSNPSTIIIEFLKFTFGKGFFSGHFDMKYS